MRDRLAAIRRKNMPCYVLAYDIGTTRWSLTFWTPPQAAAFRQQHAESPGAYGADVISRCEYDTSHEKKELTLLIRSALNSLMLSNAKKAGVSLRTSFLPPLWATPAWSTCIWASPQSPLYAPYLATVDEAQVLSPAEAGLSINPGGQVTVFPSISGFVGGDTVGVLLSLPENAFRQMTLVLDIGTNGELVLGQGTRLYTCSTAAGPAFEGAKIACGMRGADGAVDHASVKDGELTFTTVGGLPPAVSAAPASST